MCIFCTDLSGEPLLGLLQRTTARLVESQTLAAPAVGVATSLERDAAMESRAKCHIPSPFSSCLVSLVVKYSTVFTR